MPTFKIISVSMLILALLAYFIALLTKISFDSKRRIYCSLIFISVASGLWYTGCMGFCPGVGWEGLGYEILYWFYLPSIIIEVPLMMMSELLGIHDEGTANKILLSAWVGVFYTLPFYYYLKGISDKPTSENPTQPDS
jgi:hypothetical protein